MAPTIPIHVLRHMGFFLLDLLFLRTGHAFEAAVSTISLSVLDRWVRFIPAVGVKVVVAPLGYDGH